MPENKTIKHYTAEANNLMRPNEAFTMSHMCDMSDLLHEVMSDIMRRDNTLKYKHWRIRNIWKDMFNLVSANGFDNAYTENVFEVFHRAISYRIESMDEAQTWQFIETICKTMKEV